MVNITLSIPENLKNEMENFPELNWSVIARTAIAQRIQMLKKFREFTKDSTFTQEDAIKLGRELNANLSKEENKLNFVIDANIIFATLIKNSKAIDILLNQNFIIYSPEFFLEELDKYKELIIQKTYRTKESLDEILNILKEIINIISNEDTKEYLPEAKSICPDEKDVEYFALALKLKCPIWSNDKKLKEQNKIKIYSTHELINEFEVNL